MTTYHGKHMVAPERETDLELLAALMDGRLSGAERERAMKLLAEDDAAFKTYVEALRVDTDVPERTPVARTLWRVVPLAAAAGLLIAVLPRTQGWWGPDPLPQTAAAIARPLTQRADLAGALGTEWDRRPWSVVRGGPSRLVDSAIAFRLGVRAVDLEVALATADAARAGRLAGEILASLAGVPFSDAVRADYAALRIQIAGGTPRNTLLAIAARAERAMEEFLRSPSFAFGRWVGAGELAARTRSAAFFASDGTTRFLESAADAGSDAEALRRISDLVRDGVTDEEFDRVGEIFRSVLQRRGE
jgi:hypothetical protein